jgi:hypothetical protein
MIVYKNASILFTYLPLSDFWRNGGFGSTLLQLSEYLSRLPFFPNFIYQLQRITIRDMNMEISNLKVTLNCFIDKKNPNCSLSTSFFNFLTAPNKAYVLIRFILRFGKNVLLYVRRRYLSEVLFERLYCPEKSPSCSYLNTVLQESW